MTPTPAARDTDSFLDALGAIERAWDDLDAAARLAVTDRAGALALARAAALLGRESGQVLVRAAEMIAEWGDGGEARAALAPALALGGPTALVQIAYARRLRALGDPDGACRWLRGGLLRNRPDTPAMLELVVLEEEAGRTDDARRVADAARRMPCRDAAATIEAGRRLRDAGRTALARIAFERVYARGHRDHRFLIDYAALPGAEDGSGHAREVAALAAHARLALHHAGEALLTVPRAREASERWVPLDRLADELAARIAGRRPFSWLRLGDGEARFLLYMHPTLRGPLGEDDARTVVQGIWSNWFSQDIRAVDRRRLDDLARGLDRAIGDADLLGIPSVARLIHDPGHFGYCAALELHVRTLTGDGRDRRFTEALFNYPLNEADPFLATLLTGLDFLGVISPHPALATRLQARLGIGATASYDIPGEGRLDRARERADRGTHFPAAFDRIMAELSVPRPGAVFLVAGGLLGKLYCDRIRQLGGIALDIGAIADAWMGINSRGSSLDKSMAAVLPPTAHETGGR